MSKNLPDITNLLIRWYLENRRMLPWRRTKDPYRIWLSEIILQQTRVVQGTPYYERFVMHFPDVFSLAQAQEVEVLKLWQGLGYYSRARNLHQTAKYVANDLNGIFPNTYKSLLELKGVGDYTASAIASICYNEPTAVVDGNVYRVLSRLFGIDTPINSSAGIREFKLLAQSLISNETPGTFNQAIMEFGATYCTPSSPDCENCIFSHQCVAYRYKKVSQLPVKPKKSKSTEHQFHFLVPLTEHGNTWLEQRTTSGIWKNLYQFPLLDTTKLHNTKSLQMDPVFKKITKDWDIQSITPFWEKPMLHKLSHKNLYVTFWILEITEPMEGMISPEAMHQLPVPIIIGKFISEFPPFQL